MHDSKFVLDQHDALKRGKHWDLRFQIPDSKNWASFSMNKFPPIEINERIYIVRTNDHSEEEALFTGNIPKGEYGAGKITRVDFGKCIIQKYTNAHIVIDFKGKKLKGIYHFINTAVFSKTRNYSKKVYAFFKGKTENLKEQYNMDPLVIKIQASFPKCEENLRKNVKLTYQYCQELLRNLLNNQNLKNKFSSKEEYEEYVSYKYETCRVKSQLIEQKHTLVCLKRAILKCKDNLKCKQYFAKLIRDLENSIKEHEIKELLGISKDYKDFLEMIKRKKEK